VFVFVYIGALQDFDQPAQTSTNKSGSSKGNESLESSVDPLTSTDTQAHNPDPLEDILSDEMARKATEELDQAMRMLVGDNPEMMQQLEQFAQNMEETMSRLQCDEDAEYSDTESGSRRDSARQMTGADEDAKAEGLSIEEKLAQTVRELGKNAQDMKNAKVSPSGADDLLSAMSGLLLGNGDQELQGDATPEGLLPMMQQMMRNLLSRDVLYPTMTDIRDKYPKWLEEKRGHIPDTEYKSRENQYRIVSEVCQEFEEEKVEDTEETKHARFNRILNLMQKMQECGQPPPEIIGDIAPGIDFDASGKPRLPGLDQCSVM
jgi:peroxin-19